MQLQPHSSTTGFLKAYKKLISKLQHKHLDESSAVQHAKNKLQRRLEQSRLRSQYSFARAFHKLQTLLIETDMRQLLLDGRHRAREQLKRALAAKAQNSVTVPSRELEQMYGNDGLLRRCVISIVASASNVFMHQLNSTHVQGAEIMQQALQRPQGQPLITVSNHVAAMDDPLVMSTIIPQEYHSKPESIRWTLCATDRCFKYQSLVPFFRAAKVLPVQRGGGMQQEGMQAAEDRLRAGDWVHIFPEGTRSRTPGKMGKIRKGVGRLVAACETPPLVVPFVHTGMEEVMPRGQVLPRTGQKVEVLVGEPVPVEDLLQRGRQQQWTDDQLYDAIANRIGQHMHRLKAQLDGNLEHADLPHADVVSSLDLYDLSDLSPEQRTSTWDRLKFKMWHRGMLQSEELGSFIGAKLQRMRGRYVQVKQQMLEVQADLQGDLQAEEFGSYVGDKIQRMRGRYAQVKQRMLEVQADLQAELQTEDLGNFVGAKIQRVRGRYAQVKQRMLEVHADLQAELQALYLTFGLPLDQIAISNAVVDRAGSVLGQQVPGSSEAEGRGRPGGAGVAQQGAGQAMRGRDGSHCGLVQLQEYDRIRSEAMLSMLLPSVGHS